MLKLETFLQIKSSEDGEGERKAYCEQRSPGLPQCFLINIKAVSFINDVPGLASLVLVRESSERDLQLQELAESLPALSHPVDEELRGRHHGLHCCIVSLVLVHPDTLRE